MVAALNKLVRILIGFGVIHIDTKLVVWEIAARFHVRPLTPTLSPEYRGEGANAPARNEAIRNSKTGTPSGRDTDAYKRRVDRREEGGS
jgi:hypothetical protein